MPSDLTTTVDDESFTARLHPRARPTLVLFTSAECLPCHFMATQLPKLALDLHHMVDTIVCPAERSPATFTRHGIARTPALRLFVGGQTLASRDGALPLPVMRTWVGEELCRALTPPARAGRSPWRIFVRTLVARSTIVRACTVASVISPILLALNHPELLLDQPLGWGVFKTLGANFVVPYMVSSYSSARAATARPARPELPSEPTAPPRHIEDS